MSVASEPKPMPSRFRAPEKNVDLTNRPNENAETPKVDPENKAEVATIVQDVSSETANGNPHAGREGLFQLLNLSRSRIHSGIRAEKEGIKDIKRNKEIAKGRKRGDKIEAKARVQAEEQIALGKTPEEQCLGVDTFTALDQRKLAELQGDAQVLREEKIPGQKGDGKQKFEQQLAQVRAQITQTQESLQNLQTQRTEIAQRVTIPNEVLGFVQEIGDSIEELTGQPASTESLLKNPLGEMEKVLAEVAAKPGGKEALVNLIKKHIPGENTGKEIEKILDPKDRKKTGLMALLLLLGFPGLLILNAAKSVAAPTGRQG